MVIRSDKRFGYFKLSSIKRKEKETQKRYETLNIHVLTIAVSLLKRFVDESALTCLYL